MSLTQMFTCTLLAFLLGCYPVRAEQTASQTFLLDVAPAVSASDLQRRLSSIGSNSATKGELEALKAFYADRRNEPVWVTESGYKATAQLVRAELGRANDWGLDPSQFRIIKLDGREKLEPAEQVEAEVEFSLAILQYARFARGGRTQPLTLSRNLDRTPRLLDPGKVIADAVTSESPDAYLRSLHPRHAQFMRLRELLVTFKVEAGENAPKDRGDKKRALSPTREKLLANMEQWRWMPEDLGRVYVWVNIPEYTVRVIKDEREIHTERVIVGAKATPTPVLSDEMEHIIFHPRWNVPDSIKVNELLPSLTNGDISVLSRQNLRVALGGREIDPRSIEWGRTDIKKYYFYQPPGGGNALGTVKFLFPNKHDVYLHDTPSKSLFNSQARAFSHGCIRVRNPMKLAELLLAEDQGWDGERLARTVQRGPQDNQVNVSKIPVHLTYFTLWVDDDGRVRTFSDVYDHEHRIVYGLAGKHHLIRREPEPMPLVAVRQPAPLKFIPTERGPQKTDNAAASSGGKNWMKQVFQQAHQ
jgi:L,D-transpeptidase YcbB